MTIHSTYNDIPKMHVFFLALLYYKTIILEVQKKMVPITVKLHQFYQSKFITLVIKNIAMQ